MHLRRGFLTLQRRLSSSATIQGTSGLGAARSFIQRYGPVGLMTYSSISLLSMTGWVLAVRFGLDTDPILSWLHKTFPWYHTGTAQQEHDQQADLEKTLGTGRWAAILLLAWSCHSLTMPVRLGVAISATPLVASVARNRGWDVLFRRWTGFRLMPPL